MIAVMFRFGALASIRSSAERSVLVPLLGVLLVGSWAWASPPPGPRGEIGRIDFEDRETATADWSHLFDQAPGLPPRSILFDAVVDEQESFSGRSSLRFDLQGGSISYRTRRDAAIPVTEGGRYRISAVIRQRDLDRADARLEARVVDLDRLEEFAGSSEDAVAESTVSIHRTDSPSTSGRWTTVSNTFQIERGVESNPKRLAIFLSLQVVQPGFDEKNVEAVLGASPIRIEDIAGSIWFDDVLVQHLPRCMVDVDAVGDVVPVDVPIRLDLALDVPGDRPASATLTIRDLDGRIVDRRSVIEDENVVLRRVEILGLAPGWYEAHLSLDSEDGVAEETTRSFMVIPAMEDQRASDVPRFGMQIPAWSSATLEDLDVMLDALRPALVDLSLWPVANDGDPSLTAAPAIRAFSTRQRRQGREVTVSVDRLHDGIAKLAHVDPREVHMALVRDDSDVIWQALGDLLARLGAEISRWRFATAGWNQPLPGRLENLLDEHVADPHLSGSISTDELGGRGAGHSYLITSSDFSHRASEALRTSIDGATMLLAPAPDVWSHRGRLDAEARRILQAWRQGADRILISTSLDRTVTPLDLAWYVLGSHLGGRRFVGELRSSPTSHCWIAGDERGPVVVAWSDLLDAEETIAIPVGHGSFSVLSIDGSVETVSSRGGVLNLSVGGTPKIVTSIDPVAIGIASSIAMVPNRLDLARRDHEVRLRFRNPSSRRLNGRVELRPPAGWEVEPSVLSLSAGPRESVELPLRLRWNGPQPAGEMAIAGTIELESRDHLAIPIRLPVTLESDALHVEADWDLVTKGSSSFLRVRTTIRNIGARTMDLYVEVSAPGVLREQRTVSGLRQGDEVVRPLRLLGDLETLGGRTVRIEVRERGGTESIVYRMKIPGAEAPVAASASLDR